MFVDDRASDLDVVVALLNTLDAYDAKPKRLASVESLRRLFAVIGWTDVATSRLTQRDVVVGPRGAVGDLGGVVGWVCANRWCSGNCHSRMLSDLDGSRPGFVEFSFVDNEFLSHQYDRLEHMFDDDATGRPDAMVELVDRVRANAQSIAAAQAEQLRLVARLADVVTAEAVAELASLSRVPGAPQDHEVIDSALEGEVRVVLGIGPGPAARLVHLAQRLTVVFPRVLAALGDGRLDLARAKALAEATDVLPDSQAREVADQLLEMAGGAPWAGLSPRAWRARIERTVVRVDPDAARRRREQAHEERRVWSHRTDFGMAELGVSADAADVAMAMQVLTDLAAQRPATGPDGVHVSMDARRVDALMDLLRRVRDGQVLPGIPVRRERELGLVLHADTYFGDGPAGADPGELRGLGSPVFLDPVTAREHAHHAERTGAVNVLLVDRAGVLQRIVRLPKTPPGGWTRELLDAAVTARLDQLPALSCDSYAATTAIQDHVRARNPSCTGYDCPRQAGRCDLDHDTPWPRGPTDAANLQPRCRRQHEIKTRGLVETTLHPDGSVDTTMLTGLIITTRPEPLPGHAPGEGHSRPATGAAI